MLWSKRRRSPTYRLTPKKRSSVRRSFHPALEQLETRVLLAAPTYIINGSATATPAGFTPQQIKTAYGISNLYGIMGDGAGQTIAIVDAYDNPNIQSDLHKFDQQFGLKDPPKFVKMDQFGGNNLPGLDPNSPGPRSWEGEEALDVEWAHAIAPGASIVLVESYGPDPFLGITIEQQLFQAAATAAKTPGVSVVLMGWGGFTGPPVTGETSSETAVDNTFTTPAGKIGNTGVTFVAAAGSRGSPGLYPAYSPNVLAVGGTTLTINPDNSYKNETAWSGTGGGISQFEAEPQYQLPLQSTTFRTIPDVAFDADPKTGVPVYDSYDQGTTTPWVVMGGTGLSAAAWAGLVAVANGGQKRLNASNPTLDGRTGTLPDLYNLQQSTPKDYHDITSGGNGTYTATAGYDLVTGLGSPVANQLLPDVIGWIGIQFTSFTPPKLIEANDNGPFTLAAFTDIDVGDTSSQLTATVNWGDGNIDVYNGGPAILPTGTKKFAIVPDHVYAEEGTYTVSIQLASTFGPTDAVSGVITVADAPLTLKQVNAPPGAVTEGQNTGVYVVANFDDGSDIAPATDFTAIVHWGDGTTSTLSGAAGDITGSGGSYAVLAAHTYNEEITTATVISVQIFDVGGSSVSGQSSTFTIADAPLVLGPVNKPPTGLTEGSSTGTFTVATFTDANSSAPLTDFTAVISWGDGTTSTIDSTNGLSGSLGSYVIQASHTFAEESRTATVLSVQVFDAGGASVSGQSGRFTIADAPLGNLSISRTFATEGNGGLVTVATFHDTALGSDSTDFTTTISWGDGTSTQGSVVYLGTAGDFGVLGSHTYAEETSGIPLAVQIADIGGARLISSVTIKVADAPLTGLSITSLAPTEGTGTGTFTLATFQDGNPLAPVGDFTATVSWGDGTSSAATVVATGPGQFALLAAHTYADESTGPVTLSVQVLDKGGSSVSGSANFTVADAPITVSAVYPPVNPTEGISTGIFKVATFTDGDPSAPASDFTAIIHWDDGTTSTITSANGLTGGNGSFTVKAAHTYTEEISTPVVVFVQVIDVGGASGGNQSTPFTVADAPLTLGVVNKPAGNLTEGVSTGTFTVATFHDANPGAPVTDFTAIIRWGDGTTSTVTSAGGGITASAGSYAVLAAHTYEEITTATVLSVQILDVGGSSVSGQSASFKVADAPLTVTAVNPPVATEGQSTGVFTVATFSDANTVAPLSDFTAIIAWGDGSTSTITSANGLSGSAGSFVVQASHTYAEEMTGTLSVQILDVGGASASGQTTFTVADAPLTLSAIQTPVTGFTEGIDSGTFTVATFTDGETTAPPTNFTAVITWGDGTTSTLTSANGGIVATGPGAFTLLASHAYVDEGSHILSVQVTDVGGASASGGIGVVAADAPLTLKSLTPPSAFAQTSFSGVLATFADANLSAPTTDFTATITWGDGSKSAGSVQALGSGLFAVEGAHTYTNPATLPFAVSIQDRGGASTSGSGNAQVSTTPTTISVLGITDHYTFNSQQETVSARVTGPDGQPVKEGSLTFTDGGQSQTVQLVNGQASATFTFGFGHEIPNAHPISIRFEDSGGFYVANTATATAPDTSQDYFFQLAEDLLLLLLLMGG